MELLGRKFGEKAKKRKFQTANFTAYFTIFLLQFNDWEFLFVILIPLEINRNEWFENIWSLITQANKNVTGTSESRQAGRAQNAIFILRLFLKLKCCSVHHLK